MKNAEKQAIDNLDPAIRAQALAVCQIERSMRAKVEELIPAFEAAPAVQEVTSTQGEKVLKPNPEIQEIRALFKDYCAVVKAQKEIMGTKSTPAEVTSINALRQKLKIAK
jgi:hypothetical protein